MRKAVAVSILLVGSAAFGQAPTDPAFEVASVKPVVAPAPSSGGPWTVDHGRFRAQFGWVRGVIGWAYGVRGGIFVHGGPDWLDKELYDFEAKAENPDADEDQIWAMVRTLLVERFKLMVHRETKEQQVYTLTVARGKAKMQPVSGQRGNVTWTGAGQVIFTEADITALISTLSIQLGSPVIDETDLKGFYNFKLEFKDPRWRSKDGSPLPPELESRPDIYEALQDQLGLKLAATKRPVAIIVVDHVERPSEN